MFGLFTSFFAYRLEYEEHYDSHLATLQYTCQFTAWIEFVILFFKLKMKFELKIKRHETHKDTKWYDTLNWKMVIGESIFILISPTPYFSGIKIWYYQDGLHNMIFYHLNDYLVMIQALKSAYIAGLLIFQSEYASARSYRVCKMFGAKNDSFFIIKCLLQKRPLFYVFFTIFGSIGVFGYLLMVAEKPLDRVLNSGRPHTFDNSMWEAVCTMTTVGFGDIYPRTTLGRIIALICSLFGLTITSLLVITFTSI